ncbi:hypothetical protein ACOMHN_036094 [Nucella lapillus]
MLDLLVHLAARCKVSPSGHELQVRDEETGKVLEFKPNQTIGSLGATSVHLLAKNKKPEWSQAAKATGKAATMAFEITQRFTINLPGGQKAVMRVSPQMTLGQVLERVCQDKSLDTRRYTLQHPATPHTAPLHLHQTIADSKLAEINLVLNAAGDNRPTPSANPQRSSAQPASSSSSSSAAAASASKDPGSWYRPGAGETKKKKGFLSFLSKKEKKFKLDSHHNFEASSTTISHHSTSALPAPRASTPPPPEPRPSSRADVPPSRRPHTMYVTSSSSSVQDSPREQPMDHSPRVEPKNSPKAPAPGNKGDPKAPPRGGGKKRPAPPPPQARAAAMSEEMVKASSAPPVAASQAPEASSSLEASSSTSDGKPHRLSPAHAEVSVSAKSGAEVSATANPSLLHSRNSSDSSGYHELTLSGAESPEAAHVPTTFKTSIDTTSIDSGDNLNGDSGIQDMSSPGSESGCRAGSGEEPQAAAAGRGEAARLQAATAAATHHAVDDVKTLPSTKKKKAPPPPPGLKAKPAPVQEETTDMAKDETDLPCAAERPGTPPEAEKPPPPFTSATAADHVICEDSAPSQGTDEASASLKLNLDFVDGDEESGPETDQKSDDDNEEEADEETQKTAAAATTESAEEEKLDEEAKTTTAQSEYNEAFDLDAILNSVVFDEEPRRASYIHTTTASTTKEDGEREMMMVETASVVSEEVEVLDDVRSRPCEFIPPPPPDEPPPEDYSPRESGPLRFADKSTVVGEDNVSLAPASLKNSPVATQRHSGGSRNSETSPREAVSEGTEEGGLHLSLPLLTPAPPLQQDSLDPPCGFGGSKIRWIHPVDLEAARFVGSTLWIWRQQDSLDPPCGFGGSKIRWIHPVDLEAARFVGSTLWIWRHAAIWEMIRESEKERGSPSLLRKSSDDRTSTTTTNQTTLPPPPEDVDQQNTTTATQANYALYGDDDVEDVTVIPPPAASAFAMTEEISAPLETVPPPLQFQTEEEDEKEEEEEVVTVTEEYIVPVGPGGLDFSAAVKVSEEKEQSRVGKESDSTGANTGVVGEEERRNEKKIEKRIEERIDEKRSERKKLWEIWDGPGESKKAPEGNSEVKKQDVAVKQPPKVQPQPAAKEEFVLTLEDRSNVSLVPLRPKKYIPARVPRAPSPAQLEKEEEEIVSEASGSGSPQRSHLHLAYVSNRGHVQSAASSSSYPSYHQPSFAQSSSAHHTAKEPSSSSQRSAVMPHEEPTPPTQAREIGTTSSSTSGRYGSTVQMTFVGGSSGSNEVRPYSADGQKQTDAIGKPSRGGDLPPESGRESAVSPSGADLQQQYNALQQQFTVWQQQLQQNRTLLSGQGGSGGGSMPPDDNTLRTLQMQMQMQQQMMEQLQKSMQALTLQQQQGRVSPLSSAVGATSSTSSAPAPVKKSGAPPQGKKVTTQPASSRFQPQLDPREELMISVRSFGGIPGLKTVPVRDTRWASSKH